ncbi:MAG TPA: GDP-mannose 4,6-dehydratase [Terriglobales bacterium]|nr:GDP-mannose 4,6-dehydratase [Terriglobales bacterium]
MTEFSGKLLLTGASGFVGGFVQQATRFIPLTLAGKEVDLRDAHAVTEAVSRIQPDAVLHLAAQTFVPRSFENPVETFEINFLGTYNLFAALKKTGFTGRLLLVSSGDVYGAVSVGDLPVREELPPKPRSPYAVSKVAAEALCFQWNETAGFETIVARPFNHIGPGQREDFVISAFAKQIAEIKHGTKPAIIEVGDLDVTRDFLDVRDVVQAYLLLLREGRAGETYNICSGTECSIRSLLEKMLSLAEIHAEIRSNPAKFRPSEQRRVVGDANKLRRHTGWQPKYTIEQTLADTIHSWEYQIA